MIQIQKASFENTSTDEVLRAYGLLIHAYAITEVDIWGEDYVRISFDEFQELINQGKFFTARINGKIVGSINTYRISDTTFCFGLLSADFDYKGLGIGRALIQAAEEEALKNGATFMELEILKPKAFAVESKEILKKWYERLGYHFIATVDFVERKPDKAEKALKFKVPSVFDCYRKMLE